MGGRPVLCFAKAYGFRNISTVVTKVKRSKCPYDFVEVMACPSGCVNGGGQVKPVHADGTPLTPPQARDLVTAVNVSVCAGVQEWVGFFFFCWYMV